MGWLRKLNPNAMAAALGGGTILMESGSISEFLAGSPAEVMTKVGFGVVTGCMAFAMNRLASRKDAIERALPLSAEEVGLNHHLTRLATDALRTIVEAEAQEHGAGTPSRRALLHAAQRVEKCWLAVLQAPSGAELRRLDSAALADAAAAQALAPGRVEVLDAKIWKDFSSFILQKKGEPAPPQGLAIKLAARFEKEFAVHFHAHAKASLEKDPPALAAVLLEFHAELRFTQREHTAVLGKLGAQLDALAVKLDESASTVVNAPGFNWKALTDELAKIETVHDDFRRFYQEHRQNWDELLPQVRETRDLMREVHGPQHRAIVARLDQVADKIDTTSPRPRREIAVIAAAIVLLLAGLGTFAWRNRGHAREDMRPELIRAIFVAHAKKRADEEIAKLDRARDWERIAALEKTRDGELADIDRFLEQFERDYRKNPVGGNVADAIRILEQTGVTEALRFLRSKSAPREAKLERLKFAKDGAEEAIRKLLWEKLLIALLLEKDLQFDHAEAEYRSIVRDGGSWSEPRIALARLLIKRGQIIDPSDGNRKLREATDLCRELLSAESRDASPNAWRDLQNYLGTALVAEGERAAPPESLRLLADAVTAFRAALTQEQTPHDRAATQNNLAIALWQQGRQTRGAEGQQLLDDAAGLFRIVLDARSQEQLWEEWASTQNNLGNALQDQGALTNGVKSQRLLDMALTAYRVAVEVYTRLGLGQDLAATQNNLGLALTRKGRLAHGTEGQLLLNEAVTTFRAALKVRTREQPQAWAVTQHNLGLALSAQASQVRDPEGPIRLSLGFGLENLPLTDRAGKESDRSLREAVTAYRASLEVSRREHLPQHWRNSMGNLAIALRSLAEHAAPDEAAKLRAQAQQIDKELAAP